MYTYRSATQFSSLVKNVVVASQAQLYAIAHSSADSVVVLILEANYVCRLLPLLLPLILHLMDAVQTETHCVKQLYSVDGMRTLYCVYHTLYNRALTDPFFHIASRNYYFVIAHCLHSLIHTLARSFATTRSLAHTLTQR